MSSRRHFPPINLSFAAAKAFTDADRLVVTTGRMRRQWQWTDAGFATIEVTTLPAAGAATAATTLCDWQLPDGREPAGAVLHSLSAAIDDDQGFTSRHIRLSAEIHYPADDLAIRWTLWVWPDAPGLRTQLAARLLTPPGEPRPTDVRADSRVDRLPITDPAAQRRFFGYYNDTQHRNDTHLDILQEDVVAYPLCGPEWCDWASACCIERPDASFALVKESHKCVNQAGHVTGGFTCDPARGLLCTGWGLHPHELSAADFTPAWATWSLAWTGGDLARQIAFKTFDRLRFPIHPQRQLLVMSNTWGSRDTGPESRLAATEPSVLAEIEAASELGVELLQIDSGWQVPPGAVACRPGANGWHPHPESYPRGWTPVRDLARAKDLRLGLWAIATEIPLEQLKESFAAAGFIHYKLDFAHLVSRAAIDALMCKVRHFITATCHAARVNWDVTENAPRFGYFFAREYGPVWLENRKPRFPLSAVYRPHTVLRDLWQISRYINPSHFQCPIQNVALTDPVRSDAHLHPQTYAAAIALMAIPLYFGETKLCPPRSTHRAAPPFRRFQGSPWCHCPRLRPPHRSQAR